MASNYSFRWQAHWDKILFTLAALYLLTVLGWLVKQDRIKLPFITSQITETPAETPSEEDKAFMAYLNARLATIEVAQSNKPPSPSPSAPTLQGNLPTTNLPTVAISPPPKPPQPKPQPTSPSVIERIYIPIYPDVPQNTAASPPIIVRSPSPSPIPAPPPVTVNPAPVLTPDAESLPSESETALSLSPDNRLVGTLPSGDRSYAIFSLEGTPHHVRIGQWVGQTGWMLVNVDDQGITLQKNGKERRMSVGNQLFQ
ncbi:MAG: hypothetical protein AB4041_05110 [Microcystaceae cyanobacterium]